MSSRTQSWSAFHSSAAKKKKNNAISFANLDNILSIYMRINIVRSLQRKTQNQNKTKQQRDFYLN